jgi:hypothetical protein
MGHMHILFFSFVLLFIGFKTTTMEIKLVQQRETKRKGEKGQIGSKRREKGGGR